MVRLDLHLHTSVSDGLYPPAEVVRRASARRIEVIAITDHDAISGFHAACEAAGGTGCRILPGVEFSTSLDGREVHILGYFPKGVPATLADLLREMQADREARIIQGLRNLRKAGVDLTVEEVLTFRDGEILSRSHVARALVKRHAVRSFHEAFEKYLGNDVGVFPPSRQRPYRVIEYLTGEDALPVWAHPDLDLFDRVVKEMAAKGLKGVEVYSKHADPAAAHYLERVAGDFNFFMTFGSDWHGFGPESISGFDIERDQAEPFLKYFDI